mmetsp:Transcript_20899/g.40974  ORF Transcript_20899/g.40974 Transcript_20899/m.40974 type:complete len:379 (+) Transcript_20899:13-1149(+)
MGVAADVIRNLVVQHCSSPPSRAMLGGVGSRSSSASSCESDSVEICVDSHESGAHGHGGFQVDSYNEELDAERSRESSLGNSMTPSRTRRPRPSWSESSSEDAQAPWFSEVDECDVGVLRRLHEVCFPVRYNDRFYTDLGKRTYQNKPLITRVARKRRPKSLLDAAYAKNSTEGSVEPGAEYVIPDAHIRGDRGDMETVLLGGISAQIRPLDDQDSEQPLLSEASKAAGYSQGCYILTVATHPSCRRSGIGSELLKEAMRVAEEDKSCGVVYLHVITYNESAIRFYQRHGFVCVDTLRNFYRINGESFDAFLYAKFLGTATPAAPPKSIWSVIVQSVSNFFYNFFHTSQQAQQDPSQPQIRVAKEPRNRDIHEQQDAC